jgi:hypothetical protein
MDWRDSLPLSLLIAQTLPDQVGPTPAPAASRGKKCFKKQVEVQ